MSTAKHTPGPWKKDKYGSLRGSNGKQVVTKSSGLAERCSTGSEEEYANATLVAAAPALLEYLDQALQLIDPNDVCIEQREAADLVARLKGDQP